MPLYKCRDITKDREIRFKHSLTKTDQAEKAVRLLIDVTGIELAVPVRPNILQVHYDVREITLQILESALVDVGFTLHNSIAIRVKRELIAYCEGAMRSRLGIEIEQQTSLTLNSPSPHHRTLDPRPDNWRNYI